MTIADLEQRVLLLERELAAIRQQLPASPPKKSHPLHTLEKIHATFDNDAAYQEAARLGRKWRNSQGTRRQKIRKSKMEN